MNKIFKVLWNKARGMHVVTSENQRPSGKGKLKSTLLLPAVLGLTGLSVLTPAAASDFTRPSGWNHTQVESKGNLHTITTDYVKGATGVNRFDQFSVDKGHIANMVLPGQTDNLLNFVNQHITVNGTVNSIKGADVAGNLFFVTPTGMTVGKTGVINAGSLTAVVADKNSYAAWINNIDSSLDDGLLGKLQKGEVGLASSGMITIDGSIHTADRITLAAASILVNEGALLTNRLTTQDLSKLVNITDAAGTIVTSAEIAGTFQAAAAGDGTGDILLFANQGGAEGAAIASESHAGVSVAGTIDGRENVAIKAAAGGVADQNIAKVTADVKVAGTVTAQKDLTVEAKAVNIVGKGGALTTAKDAVFEIMGAMTAINESYAYGDAATKATVTVTGDLNAGGNLTTRAESETNLQVGTSTSLLKIWESMGGVEGKIPAAAAVVGVTDSRSSVVIQGKLKAGGDLTIESRDKLEASLSAISESPDDNQHAAFTLGLLKSGASVDIAPEATLEMASDGTGKLTVKAEHVSVVDTIAQASVEQKANVGLTFNLLEHRTEASVNMQTGVTGTAKTVDIAASNITEKETVHAVTSSVIDGLSTTLWNQMNKVGSDFVAGLMGRAAQGIDGEFTASKFKLGGAVAVATGEQKSSLVLSGTQGKNALTSIGDIHLHSESIKKDHHYVATANTTGEKQSGSTGTTSLAGSLALLVATPGVNAKDSVSATLTVGPEIHLTTQAGNIVVDNKAAIQWDRARQMIRDVLDTVEHLKGLFKNGELEGSFKNQWKKVEDAADELDTFGKTLGSDALSAGQQTVNFGKTLIGVAEVLTEFCKEGKVIAAVGSDLLDIVIFNNLKFIQVQNYANAFVASAASSEAGKLGAAGSAAIVSQNVRSTLTIDKGAHLTAHQGSDTTSLKGQVIVNGQSLNESTAVGGHIANIFNSSYPIALPNISDGNAVGASLVWQHLTTDNLVRVREGAELTADHVVGITAKDHIDAVTIGANADVTKGDFGIGALVALGQTDGRNALEFDDEAKATADTLLLAAVRNDNVQTVAGGLEVNYSDEANTMVAASAAVNFGDLANTVTIADNDVVDGENERSSYTITDGGLYNTWDGTEGFKGLETFKDDFAGRENLQNITEGATIVTSDADLKMNAVGAALTISMPGLTDWDSRWGKIMTWTKDVGGKFSGWSQSLQDMMKTAGATFGAKANGWGTAVHDKVMRTQNQNNGTSSAMHNPVDLNNPTGNSNDLFGSVDQNGNVTTTDAGTQNVANSAAGKSFQMSAAGSVGWNDTSLANSVVLNLTDNDAFVMHAASDKAHFDVDAVTDKWVGAWAGAAGMNFISQGTHIKNAVGIAGAVAGNSGSFVTRVDWTAANPVVVNQGSVGVHAVSDGTIVSEAISMAVSTSSEGITNYAFDAGVSVNLFENESEAKVDGVSAGVDGNISWNQSAWLGDTQVTGGTGLGITATSGGESKNLSAGILAAVAEIDNTVKATLSHATLTHTTQATVNALASATQVTTSVGVQADGGKSAMGFSGAAASSELNNTVTASVTDSSVTLKDGALFESSARGASKEEKTQFAQYTDQKWYEQREDIAKDLDNAGFYKDVALYTDKEKSKEQKLSAFARPEGILQTTVAVSAAGSGGSHTAGAGVIVNNIDNVFKATSESLTVTGGKGSEQFKQSAQTDALSIAVATGIAASGSGSGLHVNAAGSVIVSNIHQTAETSANNLTANNLSQTEVAAQNKAKTVNVAGSVGASVGEKGIGIGGAVVVMNTDNKAVVTINDATLEEGKLNVAADNASQAWGAAVEGAGGGLLGFGGSVVTNRSLNTAGITASGLTLTDLPQAAFKSTDDTELWTLAGGVAASSGKVGVNGAVAYTLSGRSDAPGTYVTVDGIQMKGSAQPDIAFESQANDKTMTMVLAAGVATQGVGFAGAAGTNDIRRKVTTDVKNLTTEAGASIADLAIKATHRAAIGNLGIVAAGGDAVGAGVGIAVNRIFNDTKATLNSDNHAKVAADTLVLKAKTSNDIDTIAVGGAGAKTVAVNGSTAINLLTDNTTAEVKNVDVTVKSAAVVESQSDDTIGAYSGEGAGAGTVAVGLSVMVNEKKGTTQTLVTDADITDDGTGSNSVEIAGTVEDKDINDSVAEKIDVKESLEKRRLSKQTTKGVHIASTSTETFKSLVLNGGGAGTVAVNGTVGVNYSGGTTKTVLTDTDVKGDEVNVFAGDYANIYNVSTTGAGAGTVAVPIAVNVVTTDHTTQTSIEGGSLTSDSEAKVGAQGKEGVSSLALAGAGAGSVSVAALVNVVRELSDVHVSVSGNENGKTAIQASDYSQKADYLGRISAVGAAAAGAQYAGVAAGVNVNYADNTVENKLSGSGVNTSKTTAIESLRHTQNSGTSVTVAGAIGSAVANVSVNTTQGETSATVEDSNITGTEDANPDITLEARNLDEFKHVDVSVAGGAGTGLAGVIVNRFYGSAAATVAESTLTTLGKIDVAAKQDRKVDITSALAGGAPAVIGANVVANFIGADGDPFDTETSGLDDLNRKVSGYIDKYGAASTKDDPGILKDLFDGTQNELTDEERNSILQSSAKAAHSTDVGGGTRTSVAGSKLQGKTVSVTAEEDTGKDANIKVAAGSGEVGSAALAATVSTLRQNRQAVVNIGASTIEALAGTIGGLIGGKSDITVWQAMIALAGGQVSYADTVLTGGANVVVNDSTLNGTGGKDSPLTVAAIDSSSSTVKSNGITVVGAGGAGQIASIEDKTSLAVTIEGTNAQTSRLTGNTALEVLRAATRTAESLSGYGGAIVPVGADASIVDSGNITVKINRTAVEGESFVLTANNRPDLRSKSYGAGAAGIGVGIAKAYIDVSGQTDATVENSVLTAKEIDLTAASGIITEDDKEAMKLTAEVNSYGGSVVAQGAQNRASLNNRTKSTLSVRNNTTGESTALTGVSTAEALYRATAVIGSGGTISSGSNAAEVNHAAQARASLAGTGKNTLKSLDMGSFVREDAVINADSAGGGVIVGEGASGGSYAVLVTHHDKSNAKTEVSGDWTTSKDAVFGAASEHELAFKADNTKGALAGGSGAGLVNTMAGESSVAVAGSVKALGSLTATARTDIVQKAYDGKFAVDSDVYGAFAGSGIGITTDVNRRATVTIAENARLTSNGDMTLSAFVDNNTDLRVRARSAGAVSGVNATSSHTVATGQTVTVGRNALLETTDEESDLSVTASGSETLHYETVGDLQGAAVGGAGAVSTIHQARNNSVVIDGGARVLGAGDVRLAAGRDREGNSADLDFYGYTHAYAHSLGGANSKLADTFDYSDTLTVKGTVEAVRNIEAAADIGEWRVSEISRYWVLTSSKDAGNVKIATSKAQDNNPTGFKANDSIVVDGALTAGKSTYSKVDISGIVDIATKDLDNESQGGSYTIEGAQKDPTIVPEGVEGTIEVGSENLANVYYERYQALQQLIAEYNGQKDKEDRSVLLAYQSEEQYLKDMMLARGWAVENADKDISLVNSQSRGFVKVSDITVSGGSVRLETDSVTGTGSIAANAARGVEIHNASNLALTVENVRVLEKGGDLLVNGVKQADSIKGFDGTVASSSTAADPMLSITSKYAGGGIQVTDNEGQTKTLTPDTSVTIAGIVENAAGNLSVNSGNDITVTANRFAAAGSLSVTAAGSVTQSYKSGMTDIGGSVKDQWKSEVESLKNKTDPGNNPVSSDTVKAAGGRMIAGGDIFIAGDNINLNGLVQSGYAEYGLTADNKELEERIGQIKKNWEAAGSPTTIDVKTSAYEIVLGSGDREGIYQLNDGTFGKSVAAWYDPVNDRVVVDDIAPTGGHIYITGRIASTGSGKLSAAAGAATVNVDAGSHALAAGNIDTGSIAGTIRITDTSYAGTKQDGKTVDARVTQWQMKDSAAAPISTYYWRFADSTESQANYHTDGQGYAPQQGLLYYWSEGFNSGKYSTYHDHKGFKGWGLFKWSEPSKWNKDEIHVTDVENKALSQGETIGSAKRPVDNDSYFYGWMTESDVKEGQWQIEKWTTYTNWTHWKGVHHIKGEKYDTSTKVYTFTVKADQRVDVGFIGGKNEINLTSKSDVLLGGTLTAQQGTVSIEAGRDIVNATGRAAIDGAANVTLTAGGDIGSSSSAIRLTGGNSDLNPALNLTAKAAGDMFIDAGNLAQGVSVKADSLTAGGTADLTVRGDANIKQLTASDIRLTSSEGGIAIGMLKQLAPEDGLPRLDARVAGDFTVAASAGDIYLGQIQAGNAVELSAAGDLIDALPRDELDERNVEDRVQSWIDAGILGENGVDNGEARWQEDVEAIKAGITADYERYGIYKELIDNENARELSESEKADFAALDARFKNVANAEAAVEAEEADSNSNLAQTISARDNYGWTKDELLYAVSDAIVNPDPGYTPQAGEANIKAKKVVLNASTGSVGHESDTRTIDFANLTTEDYKTLARADISDVVWNNDAGTVTVTLKRPISVELSESQGGAEVPTIEAKAQDNVYIASDTKLTLAGVTAGKDVRITANGIEALENTLIKGSTITLRGGSGGLGTQAAPIHIDSDLWAAFSAAGDIHVKETQGDLHVMSVSGGSKVSLASDGSIVSYTPEGGAAGRIAAKDLELTVSNGGAIGGKDFALQTEGVGTLTVRGTGDANTVAGLYVKESGTGSMILTNTQLTSTSGIAIDSLGSLTVGGSLEAQDDLSLTAAVSLTIADNTALKAYKGTIALESPDVDMGRNLSVDASGLALKTDRNLAFEGNSFTVGDKGLSIETSGSLSFGEGAVIAARTDASPSLVLTGGSVSIVDTTISGTFAEVDIHAAAGDVVIDTDSALEATDDVTVKSDTGSVSMNGQAVHSENGSVTIQAQKDVGLAGAEIDSTDGKLTIEGREGSVDVKGIHDFNAHEIAIESGKALVFEDNVELTATKGGIKVSSDGSLLAVGATVTVADGSSVSMTSDLGADLTGAVFKGSITDLTLEGKESLMLAGASTSGTAGVFDAAGNLSMATEGLLDLGKDKSDLRAGGALTVNAGKLSVADGSSFAAGDEAVIRASEALTAGSGLNVQGASVSVTGGRQSFVIGDRASFTAENGGVDVLSDGDMKLGGAISVDARKTDQSEAGIRIGAQRVLSVENDAARITAANGSVTVYGGEGMVIRNDLTVISQTDTRLVTDSGDLNIGNNAVVMAGTQSGLAQNKYGEIAVEAGGSFTIGESAEMLADNLSIASKGDLTFGSQARLYGAAGGVALKSSEGSIHMGGNLNVESTHAEKSVVFDAAQDIVIDHDATVRSDGNAIAFKAGNDVHFAEDFTADGEGFTINAVNDVAVGDNAYVKTTFDNEKLDTAITAGNSIVFGDNARFETTELAMSAQKGDVTFGTNADIHTSYAGIVVESQGDITFGESAQFRTDQTNVDSDIALTAGGRLTLEKNARIDVDQSEGRVTLSADQGIDIGDDAKVLGNFNDPESLVVLTSTQGNVRLGTRAEISGYVVRVQSGDENLTRGGDIAIDSGAFVTASDDFTAQAYGDIDINGSFSIITPELEGVSSAQEITFKTQTGDIDLHDDAVMYAHGELSMTAEAGNVRVGDDALIVTEEAASGETPDRIGEHDIVISAGKFVEFGSDSLILTDADMTVWGREGVSVGSDAVIGSVGEAADKGAMTLETQGAIDIAGGVYGENRLSVRALGNVTLSGEAIIDSAKRVEVTSGGDVVMRESARIGGGREESLEATQSVVIASKGDVVQREPLADAGIIAQKLEVHAQGKVDLKAAGPDVGNRFETADIDSGGDVTLGLSGSGNAHIAINRENDGRIEGGVTIAGLNNRVTVEDLHAARDVSIVAKGIKADEIESLGSTVLATTTSGGKPDAGVDVDKLTAGKVLVSTHEGGIRIGELTTTTGNADIYRKSTSSDQTVYLGVNGRVAGDMTVINGQGNVTGEVAAAGAIRIITQTGVADTKDLVSASGKVAVMKGAQYLVKYLPEITVNGSSVISGLTVFDFSALNFIEAIKREALLTPESVKGMLPDGKEDSLVIEYRITDRWTPEVLENAWISASASKN